MSISATTSSSSYSMLQGLRQHHHHRGQSQSTDASSTTTASSTTNSTDASGNLQQLMAGLQKQDVFLQNLVSSLQSSDDSGSTDATDSVTGATSATATDSTDPTDSTATGTVSPQQMLIDVLQKKDAFVQKMESRLQQSGDQGTSTTTSTSDSQTSNASSSLTGTQSQQLLGILQNQDAFIQNLISQLQNPSDPSDATSTDSVVAPAVNSTSL